MSQELQSDYMVSIYVGKEPRPFQVQRAALVNISDRNPFKDMLDCRKQCNLQPTGSLYFHQDDVESWKILLYLIILREWEYGSTVFDRPLLIDCWLLGEKYGIPDFCDSAMRFLFDSYIWDGQDEPEIEEIKKVFTETQPGSKLGELMADVLVGMLRYTHQTATSLCVDQWTSLPGFGAAMVEAHGPRNMDTSSTGTWTGTGFLGIEEKGRSRGRRS